VWASVCAWVGMLCESRPEAGVSAAEVMQDSLVGWRWGIA